MQRKDYCSGIYGSGSQRPRDSMSLASSTDRRRESASIGAHHKGASCTSLRSEYSESSEDDSGIETIALFGPDGKCGYHFLRMALDAGYNVNILLSPKVSLRVIQEFAGQPRLAVTTGSLDDEEKIEEVVHGADYVVCMLNDTLPSKREYPELCLLNFMQRLYSVLRRPSSQTKLVVFQSNSLAPCVKGGTPLLSKVLKTAARNHCAGSRDQSAVVKFISSQHGITRGTTKHSKDCDVTEKGKFGTSEYDEGDENSTIQQVPDQEPDDDDEPPSFDFLITRPTLLLQDGPSNKELKTSRSQPGPFPIRHVDVASFTLNALHNERVRNTSPYLVADSF